MTRTLYVTTTIPYVNAPPHVGFALELVQADAIARYHRLVGETVRLQTGTDENAFKNVLSAKARGVSVETLVEENATRFQDLCRELNISHDVFLRTTDPPHRHAVGEFFARLRPGDVYRAPYRGLYCPGCEDFYLERDLDGHHCPEHHTPVVTVEECNYFFRLPAYAQRVRHLISSRRLHVVPEAREIEVLRFLDRGLVDISISRDAARSAGWGIPFPGDPSQVVYVWIDALVNYLSGLGFPGGEQVPRFWNDNTDSTKLHLIGKNVWKFHAIYWPALLLSAGLPVPDRIVVHGFLTHEGAKISKSSGVAPDPVPYIHRFGADAVRHFLLRHTHPFQDADFSLARLEAAYEADLANGLGNLVSRLTALCETIELSGTGAAQSPPAPPDYHEHCRAYRYDLAIASLWNEVSRINAEISEARPWEQLSAGHVCAARVRLIGWVNRLAAVGHWLQPVLPVTGATIREALSRPLIRRCGPLFPRRDR